MDYQTPCCRSSVELILGISDSALVKGCQDLLQKHNAGSSDPSSAANGLSGQSTSGQTQNRADGGPAVSLPVSHSPALTGRAQDKRMSYPAVYQPSLHYAGARNTTNEVSDIVTEQPSNLDSKPEAMQAPPALTLDANDSISLVQLPAQPLRQSDSQSSLLDAVLDEEPPAPARLPSVAGPATAATGNALQQPRSADLAGLHTSTQLPGQEMPSSISHQNAGQSQRAAHRPCQLQHGDSLLDVILVDEPSAEDQSASRHQHSQAPVRAKVPPTTGQDTIVHKSPSKQASNFQSLLNDLLA